jgi:arylsulfatase A-like enzyme
MVRRLESILLATALMGPGDASAQGAGAAPSVLLYVIDTLRADSLPAYGNTVVSTPAIDRLAREGTLFERAYAPSSWTRASMATILSGLPPEVHGAEDRLEALPEAVVALAESFRERGYQTACITANPNIGRSFGFGQGFDDFIELYAAQERSVAIGAADLITPSEIVTQRARAWLEKAARPFFLVILSIDPHGPYEPPERFDRYGPPDAPSGLRGDLRTLARSNLTDAEKRRIRSLYWAEISRNDAALGELLESLRGSGRLEETVVVLTSDHGEEFWEHGDRGHARTLYEEVLRVPLIVRYPPRVPAGRRDPRVVQLVDLAPTLLSLARASDPADPDARSLLEPRSASRSIQEGPVFAALRLSNQKGRLTRLASLRKGEWKLLWDLQTGERRLHQLEHDPGEQRDLAGQHPELVRRLAEELRRHQLETAERHRVLAAGGAPKPLEDRQLPERTREMLRALGYVDEGDQGDPEPRGEGEIRQPTSTPR